MKKYKNFHIYFLAFILSAPAALSDDDQADEDIQTAFNIPGLGWLTGKTVAPGFYNNTEGSPLLPLVGSAKESIDIEIYEMKDIDLRAALRAALERGVRVRVVKDPNPIASKCNPLDPINEEKDDADCRDEKQLATEIQAKNGGTYVAFNKEQLCGIKGRSCFEHGKMVIVDTKTVMMSTGNFNSSSLCNLKRSPSKCNRDFSYVSRRPFVVKGLSTIFEKDLQGKSYDLQTLVSSRFKKKVTVSPFSTRPLVTFIESARRSIDIENQYLKEEAINQALIAASKRGVKVRMTLSSLCSYGKPKPKAAEALTKLFTTFDEAKISTRMFTDKITVGGKPGYMHAKAIVVDGWRAWVGSVNGSFMSTSQNREFGIFFWNPFSVGHLKKILREDHADERGETWQESLECFKDGYE